MKKPSKFSSRYTRHRRSRTLRRNAIIAGSVLALLLLFLVPYLYGKINEYRDNNGNFDQVVRSDAGSTGARSSTAPTGTSSPETAAPATDATRPESTTSPAATTAPADTTTPATLPDDLKAAGYTLSNGTDIRILYVSEPGGVRYYGAEEGEGQYTFDLSPEGDQILLNEVQEQNLIIIGPDLVAEDHSFDSFNHEDGRTLSRQDYKGGDFVWMRNARFLTGDIILFESQVSNEWDREYIRYYDRNQEIYRLINGTWANSARLIERTVGGYQVQLDDRLVIITPDLEVAE